MSSPSPTSHLRHAIARDRRPLSYRENLHMAARSLRSVVE
jgi:hypothetical protein